MKEYRLSEEIFKLADVKGTPQNMTEWLKDLSDAEFDDWNMIATRPPNMLSMIETKHAIFVSLVLLSYELDSKEVFLDQKKGIETLQLFLTNIIVEKGRRRGLYLVEEPLSLCRLVKVQLTELGKKVGEELIKQEKEKGNDVGH